MTRIVRLPHGLFPVGHFAGTTVAHPMVLDAHSGTCCQLCFGPCDDSRHLGADILPSQGAPIAGLRHYGRGQPMKRTTRRSR